MSLRFLDIVFSVSALIACAPVLVVSLALIWLQDLRNPVYVAERVGKQGKPFKMVKLRTMAVGSDVNGVESTAADDDRITFIGSWLRRYKIDELLQLVNVVAGDMSLVGPRPNTVRGTSQYTTEELDLLRIAPGMTDIASIVFSDEGDVLRGSLDPDGDYDVLIRPWKSKLALIYRRNCGPRIYLTILMITALSFANRRLALRKIAGLVGNYTNDLDLVRVSMRDIPLGPSNSA